MQRNGCADASPDTVPEHRLLRAHCRRRRLWRGALHHDIPLGHDTWRVLCGKEVTACTLEPTNDKVIQDVYLPLHFPAPLFYQYCKDKLSPVNQLFYFVSEKGSRWFVYTTSMYGVLLTA